MLKLKISNRSFVFWFLLLVIANLFIWTEISRFCQQSLEVTFFDVGQGDAILVETPERHLILIDGGPDDTILEKMGQILPFWRQHIDLVILTHPHADHLYGLIQILDRYQVDYILWSGVECLDSICQLWKDELAEDDSEIIIAQAGQRIRSASMVLDVLYPLTSYYRYLPDDHNEVSIVTKLSYGNHTFLFTGDITDKGEKEMILAWDDYLLSNIMKVAHHGSISSSQEEFLDTVRPEIAIIQVGVDNQYGHPAQETIDKLINRSIIIHRTDENGDIKIISNGLNYYYE